MPDDGPELPEDPFDDLDGDDEILGAPLPPEDRLWRHPAEVAAGLGSGARRSTPPVDLGTVPAHIPRLWAVALVSGLVGSTLTVGVVAAAGLFDRPVRTEVVERVAAPPVLDGPTSLTGPNSVADIARRVQPTVARIVVETSSGPSAGPAAVLDSEGNMVTTLAAVGDATEATVTLADGRQLSADVAARDPETQLALVVMEPAERPDDLDTVLLGTRRSPEVGEPVVVVASGPTTIGTEVTSGIVSALNRRVVGSDGHVLYDLIQTDAPMSSDATGGFVFDGAGALIGVATAGDGGTYTYASPAALVHRVAKDLIAHGEARHVWLGIEGTDGPSDDPEAIPGPGARTGALVQSVASDSPADEAGIQVGDLIVGIDGERVASMTDLVVALRLLRPGDEISIQVMRSERSVELTARLTEKEA